ncbi:hypothetical protein OIO90_003261 [Microbotryomycetes sp. JL221]|nr:hypothetical protein OIO90_003261 [Microbotryomycetes sp. JL221]
MASASAVAGPSTTQSSTSTGSTAAALTEGDKARTPTAPLGRRAKLTHDALMAASRKVTKSLTDKAMLECFPELAQAYERAYNNNDDDNNNNRDARQQLDATLSKLKQEFLKDFDERIPILWQDTCQRYQFVERANELDRIVDIAKQSKVRGDEPKNMFFYGADGTITIPSATIPVLRDATEQLKAKRVELENQNKATFEQILQDQAIIERTEQQLKDMVADFKNAMETLRSIDSNELSKLQEQLLQSVTAEEVP